MFAYRSEGGLRCSLHSAAEDLGVPPADVKPSACLLWPLAITSGPRRALTVHDDACRFPCNRPRAPKRPGLHSGVAELIETAFDRETRIRIEQAASEGLPRLRVPLRGRLAHP